jgi:hypothetical protein
MRSVRFYWESEATYPRVAAEFVFLAKAFNEVGAALYPETWTGREWAAAPDPLAWPIDESLRPCGARAAKVVSEAQPTTIYRKTGLFGGGAARPVIVAQHMAHVVDWAERRAQDEVDALLRERTDLHVRRSRVAKWIARAGLSGEILTFVQARGERGDPHPVKPSAIWGGDLPLWDGIFKRCELPMVGAAGEVSCYIYLGRSSLDRALRAEVGAGGDAEKPQAAVCTAAAISDCEKWLRREFINPERAATSRPEFLKLALAEFPDRLSGRGFGAAWNRATEDFPERRRAGRRGRNHDA